MVSLFMKLIRLTDIKPYGRQQYRFAIFECECGAQVEMRYHRGLHTKTCGCKRGNKSLDCKAIAEMYQSGMTQSEIAAALGMTPRKIYLVMHRLGIKTRKGGYEIPIKVGDRYGSLVTLKKSERGPRGHQRWVCSCDCGMESVVCASSLVSGNTKSCGCLKRDGSIHMTHGATSGGRSPEYSSWSSMHNRCSNPKNAKWNRYGGRGIKVCERWNSFENFLEDMGSKPSGTSIDRIDNNGNYEPGNCRWATPKEQANNTRRNVRITANGKSLTVAEWARETGLPYTTIQKRLRCGNSHESSLRV